MSLAFQWWVEMHDVSIAPRDDSYPKLKFLTPEHKPMLVSVYSGRHSTFAQTFLMPVGYGCPDSHESIRPTRKETHNADV